MIVLQKSKNMQLHSLSRDEVLVGQSSLFSNTGYRRTYHKTDKVESLYFETGGVRKGGHGETVSVGIELSADVTDIEQWVSGLAKEAGYESLKEMLPHLSLPVNKAVVIDCAKDVAAIKHADAMELVRHAVILSKCSAVGYDPDSPMIFSEKRMNRAISLLTINLKSFYELD